MASRSGACHARPVRFFDEPPPSPPSPPSYRTPEWIGPPENVIPATVALDAILLRRPELAIWIADALVFPSGLSFGINIQRRERSDAHEPPMFFGPVAADDPRFGLQLADGRKVVVRRLGEMQPFLKRPDQPVLRPRSGSGGANRSRADMWLWPLPPAGPLTFVCAWPAEAVGETSVQIDAAPILAAASRAVEMWPDDRPLPPSEDDVVI
jgi:hypothetical protein